MRVVVTGDGGVGSAVADRRRLRGGGCGAGGLRALHRESPLAPEAIEYVTHPGSYSIERARRERGWSPDIALEDGMRSTLAWVDQHLPA